MFKSGWPGTESLPLDGRFELSSWSGCGVAMLKWGWSQMRLMEMAKESRAAEFGRAQLIFVQVTGSHYLPEESGCETKGTRRRVAAETGRRVVTIE